MPTLPGKRKKLFITSAALATMLAFSNAAAFGAMGGSKGSNAPCITKGNATAQYNSLKSANKQSYCVVISPKLTVVILGSYLDWYAAKADAISRGGKLTGIRSQTEQDLVDDFILNNTSSDIWLSGIDAYSNGTWVWDDSGVVFATGNYDTGNFLPTPGLYSNWAYGEPNGFRSENCVSAVGWMVHWGYPDSQWNNLPCGNPLGGYLMRTN